MNSLNTVLLVSIAWIVISRTSGDRKRAIDYSKLKTMPYDELSRFVRKEDMTRLKEISYFDWASHSMFPDSLMINFSTLLHENLFGNTHSESPSASKSSSAIEDARDLVLDFFDTSASSYTVMFTYSDAHALKLLAEAFPFDEQRTFYYSKRSNENILGLRGFAQKHQMFEDEESDERIIEKEVDSDLRDDLGLVAFPLVDSFDGHVMNEKEMKSIFKRFGDHVLVADASLYLQTHRLSLKNLPFHAVAFSFDKLLGFPNIGALVIHNSVIPHLRRPYFGGGTLVYALTGKDFERLRMPPSERFEDGSLPFLSIASLKDGFHLLDSLGPNRVKDHVERLTDQLKRKLQQLKRTDGTPLIQIYGKGQSSIITFNVLDERRRPIPWEEVVRKAASQDIYLAGGCHFTPGTCASALNLDIKGDLSRIAKTGAIRASLGWSSSEEEIEKLIGFLRGEYLSL